MSTPPPTFAQEDAARLATHLYGIEGRLSTLRSERDQNFRIDAADGAAYVLKISNPADDRSVIEMQTEAMRHVARQDPELPVMRVVPTRDGDLVGSTSGQDRALPVRLVTLLPGRMARAGDLEEAALEGFGTIVARMGRALRGFFHPAGGYEILWDLKHALRMRPLLDSVEDPGRRALAERVLDRFEEYVEPTLPGLRGQIVHNDLTIDNVLVDERGRVSGIVDFGDLTHTALVCDLAIALASLMWERADPFEAAAAALRGYGRVTALGEEEAGLLGDLVAARITAWGVIAAWRVRRFPENADYITAGDASAWELLAALDAMGFPEVSRRLSDACLVASLPYRRTPTEPLLERRRRVLGRSPLMYDRPVHLVRGEGVWMFDAEGRRYLDAYNNVPAVGHGHPRVTGAIAAQARALNTNTRYLHEAPVELAERLLATMGGELDSVVFVNSGSEANDLAWRIARAVTRARGAIASTWAYHGLTEATAAVSPEEWGSGERPDHVELIPAPDGYRGPHRRDHDGWASAYAEEMDRAARRLGERGVGTAAFFVDPPFTSDGILLPPEEYLQEALRRIHAAGGLMVGDEVQAGHGRLGSHLWSFQASGVDPDLVVLGKPMGNGHPVAAVVTRADLLDALTSRTEVFSTFGGNPVSCAAALAVLDVIQEEGLQASAADVGSYLLERLKGLGERHPLIGDVRGKGLLIGVDLVRDRESREPASEAAKAVVNLSRDRGVLIRSTGPHENVLKIRPPLVFRREHADLLLETLDDVFGALPT